MRMNSALLIAAVLATTQSPNTAGDALVGNWRGNSNCLVRPSACVDEKSLYHIKKLDQPNHYSVQGDKIVGGRPVDMGTVDCVFSSEKQALTCELPKGAIHLELHGAHLEGTMNLADGTLWRKINLEKDPAR
jgi:hypothetical protein